MEVIIILKSTIILHTWDDVLIIAIMGIVIFAIDVYYVKRNQNKDKQESLNGKKE